jgi:hypothetical protein
MPLSHSRFTSAFLGTKTHPIAPEPLTSPTAQALSGELQLLQSVAVDALRTQAGYLPLHDPRPVPPLAPPTTTLACGPAAIRLLHLILAGPHRRAFKAWCMALRDAGRHVPPEGIPTLLRLGHNRKHLRPFIHPIIGIRGHWLANEIRNQNWKWILAPAEMTIEQAVAEARLQEKEILDKLRNQSDDYFVWHLARLSDYRFIEWSDELFEALLVKLEQTAASGHYYPWRSDMYIRALTPLAYYFPLGRQAELKTRLEAAPAFKDHSGEIIASLDVIFRFRQAVRRAASEESL